MGRLDNIIARNRPGGRPKERTVVMLGAGLILLLIISLMLFTNLGTPNVDAPPPPRPPDGRVHDIGLGAPPRKAPAAKPPVHPGSAAGSAAGSTTGSATAAH